MSFCDDVHEREPTTSVILRADVLASLVRDRLSSEEREDFERLVAGLFGDRDALPATVVPRLVRGTTLLREGLLRGLSGS